MRYWYKYLVYISIIFLAVALYNANFLKIPQVFSIPSLLISFIFLFAGFIANTISWKQILKISNYHVALRQCLAGVGLSVFWKYIPGKIWIILGKAAYITEKERYPLGKISAISLNAQFITLWTGLIFGLTGLFLLGEFHSWGWIILLLFLALTAVIFSRLAHSTAERILNVILRKEIKIPILAFKLTTRIMPIFALTWVLWSTGFYMLVLSLSATDIPWSVGFGFPLAGTLGIMAVIAPGGLGAREGVIVGYLAFAGIPVAEATAIAVASRLWFFAGEIFIFIIGWIAHKGQNKALHKVDYQ
jgi:uncharacterized membrane protein YbhN (UPF0104 family)